MFISRPGTTWPRHLGPVQFSWDGFKLEVAVNGRIWDDIGDVFYSECIADS